MENLVVTVSRHSQKQALIQERAPEGKAYEVYARWGRILRHPEHAHWDVPWRQATE